MVKHDLKSSCIVGLDFYKFLKETQRTSIKNRLDLRDIYNNEFRRRDAQFKDPNFGSVLYALKTAGKIKRRRDVIHFNPSVTDLYVDQRQTPRGHQARGVHNGAASPDLVRACPPHEAVTGVQACGQLASSLLNQLSTHRDLFIADKNGISITSDSPIENGKLSLCVQNTEYTAKLTVKNVGAEPVYFISYTPLYKLQYFTLLDEHKVTKTNPLAIQAGDSYEIKVDFRCTTVGFYEAALAFEFKPDLQHSTATFTIVRSVEVHFITSLGIELAPTAPFRPQPLLACASVSSSEIVDGQPPESLSLMLQNEIRLQKYPLPNNMYDLIKSLKHPKAHSDKRRVLLESPLRWMNYAEKLKLLLHLEECQMEVDIKKYNIPNNEREHATMELDRNNRNLLVLEVPGVSENRPSVLRGDNLTVWPIGKGYKKYRGYVHNVELDSVKLGFAAELLNLFVKNMKFHVEFSFNRLTLCVQHRAAELAISHRLGNVLFPAAPANSPQPTELPDLRLFDSKLEKNQEQYEAVQHIIAGSSKPAPYLVFGPPGTGKTVTMVEAIKQIEKTQGSCRILACAPSNSAADLLCQKIMEHMDKRKVYRMYAKSFNTTCVPEELKACSNLAGDYFQFPLKEKLMEYKIMVTTLITAGRLVTGGIPPGHFTHIFVDEAGHAVETECLISLAGLLCPETGQVVLAGDPKQLGPIIRSTFALKYGLGVSLLERLMTNFSVYQKKDGKFNNHFVTKLLRNYRSHPAILKIPNEMFYDNELLCCADEYLRNSYCSWEHLPPKGQGFPVIFHAVNGKDEREASSPSFFNRDEVEVLMGYLKKVLQTQGKKGHGTISPKDIGIIAPYRKQVQKIRQALCKVAKDLKMDLKWLKVGCVEEFQGQERKVVLVSTVRSNPNYAEMDKKFSLGFVKNEKRFNVALTRAKALLIVVGNPMILKSDATWDRFIKFCSEKGGYTGFVPPQEDSEFLGRLAALSISMKPEAETAESVVQQHLDPEWRNDL
ncbi:putative helicase mov-10-B.2 [Echeneis naucrates]|uniref:RNA helicase n=1 Tax=Echeneis naucrates TaxID=173247 RepID=A0A665U4B8_ECHNA|nr:putative helicase mov-10-B.2 [Echeneis naucrates]